MSESEDSEKGCQACAAFEPQAWRKSLCRNCFHSLEEHSAELLAAEGELFAREMAAKAKEKQKESPAAKTEAKPETAASKAKDVKSSIGSKEEKDTSIKDTKPKSGAAAKDSGKEEKKWGGGKDLGLEYGKTTGKAGASTTVPTLKGKYPLATTAASSSTSTPTLPSLKSSPKGAGSSQETTITSPSIPSSNLSPNGQKTPISKAKNFASKFESKAEDSVKEKASGKSSSSSAKVEAKAQDLKSPVSKLDSKTSPWKKTESSKLSDAEPNGSKTTASDSGKLLSLKSYESKKSANEKDSTKANGDSKDKKFSALSSTSDEKDSKFSKKAAPFGKDMLKSSKDSSKKDSEPSQAEKSSLCKTKDTGLGKIGPFKNSLSPSNDKDKGSVASKFSSGKFNEEKNKKSDENTEVSGKVKSTDTGQAVSNARAPDTKFSATDSHSLRDSEQTDSTKVNKAGHLAKTTGKIGESEANERTDSAKTPKGSGDVTNKWQSNKGHASPTLASAKAVKDKSAFYRDRGKETGGEEADGDKKADSTASSPFGGKQESPPTPSSLSLKLSTPTTPTSALDCKTPTPLSPFSKAAADKKPKDLKLDTGKDSKSSLFGKFKDLDKTPDKGSDTDKAASFSSVKSPTPASPLTPFKKDEFKESKKEKATSASPEVKDSTSEKLKEELKLKEEKLRDLNKKLSKMEEDMKKMEKENTQLKKESVQSQKDDMEKLLKDLKSQLSKMEGQCCRLETDNQSLIDKLHAQEESVKRDQNVRGKNSDNVDLEEDLEAAEKELEDVKDENKELQRQIMEMKNEMDEMHDHFRENEHDEFREIQKELDMTAKNCRILQFKLRKAERRNEQIEEDRIHYEEKLRMLQDQFDSQDAKNHIKVLEEELRIAKEVSVRLHDELDIVEDKRNKALEENRHLTELLEHTDKRQFRLEMEIDKLRDIVADLKQQLKEAKSGNNNNNRNAKESTPERKPPLGAVGKQGSKEYDTSQLMKDLCDSMERENDLKDQLKFSEEEAKMMRRRVSEIDEENESLRHQLQKMSEKASKHKKKEKERLKELEEERKQTEAVKAALIKQRSEDDDGSDLPDDIVLVIGSEGSDVMTGDEPIPITQRKDSTDEDLMNVMQMRVQLEMLEQELMMSHKKLDEMDLENENLQAEVKFLQGRLAEKEANEASGIPEPSTPNAYYEDKLKELMVEADDLRWKLIEKDREIERLSVVQSRHSREHKKPEKLKKSKSLDTSADPILSDLRKQLEHAQMEIIRLKKSLEVSEEQIKELHDENEELKNKTQVPAVRADDAALENIDLKEKMKKLEDGNQKQAEQIKSLTENLQKLSRDKRTYKTIATSPTVPGTLGIPGIPLVGPGTQAAHASAAPANNMGPGGPRDLSYQLHVLRDENLELRRLMAEWEFAGKGKGAVITKERLDVTTCAGSSNSSDTGRKKETTGTAIDDTTKRSLINDSGKTACCQSEDTRFLKQNLDLSKLKSKAMDAVKDSKKDSRGEKEEFDDDRESDDVQDEEEGAEGKATSKSESEDEPISRSILLDYPEGKSKVNITGNESRVELMEKVLDMDDEIGEILSFIRRKEEEADRCRREAKSLKAQLREMKDDSRRTELELLQELDMLHDKNSVMSNLLDIINERAEAAEEELERRIHEDPAHSPVRSASNVSQVSALSDTSMGSDEVFLGMHGNKEGVITRDWEAKLKVRIESLERLLAEERQKVATAEKKLILAGIESMAPSVSDDVKLRMREKELLQEELLKSQRHLHIATDQIQGLKERINILEEEHQRLKNDYGKLYDEIDKPLDNDDVGDKMTSTQDPDKTPENSIDAELPFVAKRISVVEAPKYRELKRLAEETSEASEETAVLEAELEKYKQKAKELEYKVEEINDIWRSKSAASEKEKDELEIQLKQKLKEFSSLEGTIENLRLELHAKDKIIAEYEVALREKDQAMSRETDKVKDHEGATTRHEQDKQSLLNQISHREETIRGLNETVRIRDERLKEKDDILFKLNSSIGDLKKEMNHLGERLQKMSAQLSEKDAVISTLREQLSNLSSGSRDMCQTDAEKESFRLKEALRKLQMDLDNVLGEKRVLEATLEKSRRALDDARLMWDEERGSLQKDVNILDEKVRVYEAYNTMGKDESIEALKSEAQGYFNEKENLALELSSLKMKHESVDMAHSEQVARLQREIGEKLRMLKTEVDKRAHMTTEMERLKKQAEMAFRLQQEQRMLKAEHLAMKVRYETRIDNMSKDHNKMLVTIEKLQKERSLDKEIIEGIQKNFTILKDKYSEELLKSEADQSAIKRQFKEIEETRGLVEELQKHIRDLKEKTLDQDRLRSELINKFATDRSSWEIERASLNSQINQFEEQQSSRSRQQERSKDIQVNMRMTWDKERREQRRLLQEAHTLALDLQEQLRTRDESFAHERKELMRQLEKDRLAWTKEKREVDRKLSELEAVNRKVAALQKRLKEEQERWEKKSEHWKTEKTELLHLLGESRRIHMKNNKKLEDILSNLIRLRELGSSFPSSESLEEKPPDKADRQELERNVREFVKEAIRHVSQAADDLTVIINPTTDEATIKRISSSEIELLKEELTDLHTERDEVFTINTRTPIEVHQRESGEFSPRVLESNLTSQKYGASKFSDPITQSTAQHTSTSSSYKTTSFSRSEPADSKQYSSSSTTQVPPPVIIRPFDPASRRYDRPPSYTSGTRSAQSSRATTPDFSEQSGDVYPFRKSGFPEPPRSIFIPHHKSLQQSKPLTSALSSGESLGKPRRPVTFMKSLSVDSPLPYQESRSSQLTNVSANNTPVTEADIASTFSTSPVISSSSRQHLSASKGSPIRSHSVSPSRDRVSPRTARRKFFEDLPSTTTPSSYPTGYQSWPERQSASQISHFRQQSLPNPEEVRREVDEEYGQVSSKLESEKRYAMKTSTSVDEKIHFKNVSPDEPCSKSDKMTAPATSSTQTPSRPLSKHAPAKEKRKFFKKAASVDSTVSSSIAKVGVSAISPGAPTGFTPSELFAAVKGKLKPVFKRKSNDSGTKSNDPRSPSPLFIQTEVPDIHFACQASTALPIPVPHVDIDQLESSDTVEGGESMPDFPCDRSRDSRKGDAPRGKWRSKSADRAHSSLGVHADVIRPASGVWQFTETAL